MRLIDADIFNHFEYDVFDGQLTEDAVQGIDAILNIIDDAPTIEAEPIRHGHWTIIKNAYGEVEGFIHEDCGRTSMSKDAYCPRCGAKMEGVEE